MLKIVINNWLLSVLILVNNCKKNRRLRYCSENCDFFYVGSGVIFLSPRPLLLSQRESWKLCNGENFRIKAFDEFRCFWGSWVRIIGFKKMYVCVHVCKSVCMYVCMKPNFVPVITLERMDRIGSTFTCILGMYQLRTD